MYINIERECSCFIIIRFTIPSCNNKPSLLSTYGRDLL